MIKPVLSVYSMAFTLGGAWLYNQHLFVTPALYIIGALVLGFGLYLFCKQLEIFSNTRKTYGKLTGWGENLPANPDSPRTYYYARVDFEDSDGTQRRVTSATGSRQKPTAPIGHSIPVRYDPSNPDDARVDTFFDFWGPSIVIAFFGALTIAMSFVRGGH